MSDHNQFVLFFFSIFWSLWGIWLWIDIKPYIGHKAVRGLLFAASGPCVWAIGLYRGIKFIFD